MSQQNSLYSESWHRVANQHIRLRNTVQIHKQSFRGEVWYVVEDPFNNRFFRFRPEAYNFIARLDAKRSVDEVWRLCLEETPESAPGQPEVIRMLAQLYQASLLESDLSPDATRLFDRHHKQKQRELKGKLLSILFVRIPLFDPNKLLNRLLPLAKPFLSKFGFIVWTAFVLLGLKTALDHSGALMDQSQGMLAPNKLFLLYITFLCVKVLHEVGHGLITKKYGGEVHNSGLMLMVFNPIPYIDTTSAWAFRERWKRVLVGSGGMIVELFLASIAAFVWAATTDGLIHSIAYNVMFIASVSTLLLNINPLMRFDGYYILSDLTDTPNLHQRANRHIQYLFERYLYRSETAITPAESKKEGFWLTVFAIAGWIYRLFIFTVILWFVADRFFGLGFIAAMIGLVTFFIVPIVKLVLFLLYEPRIEEVRSRAQWVTAAIALGLIGFLALIPMPNAFRAEAIVEAVPNRQVYTKAPGYITAIQTPMSWVEPGDNVFQLSNDELSIQLQSIQAELAQIDAVLEVGINDPTIRRPAERRKDAIRENLARLEAESDSLDFNAPIAGIWVAPRINEYRGSYLKKGEPVGILINPDSYGITAVVEQRHAMHLFNDSVRKATLRIPGQGGTEVSLENLEFIPAEQNRLPHASLGWNGGGDIEVAPDDRQGTRAVEPFFIVQGDIVTPESSVAFAHNLGGVVRFELPPKPYLWQAYNYVRQMLQQRFEI